MPDYHLSRTARQLKRSVMRDLMSVAVDPRIISLAGGLPANDCVPVESFQQCVDRVLSREGYRALQYGPPYMPLREWIADYMRKKSVKCDPEEVFITNGAQQGLAILSRLFCDPEDPVVIESTTFTGIQQVTVGRRLSVRTVSTHLETGVDVQALEEAFSAAASPKMAILIPDFHNPLGVSISMEKREQIAALAARRQIPVIEDDPYSALRFSGESLPPMKALDHEGWIFYLGSFSKMLTPAVRLGWIIGPRALADRITVIREAMDLESSQLMQRVVMEFIDSGFFHTHLHQLNRTNARRFHLLQEALQQWLAPEGVQWTQPEGGIFIWLTFPQRVNTWKLFQHAIKRRVAFIPGGAFSVEGGNENTARLNFSNVTEDRIPEAVRHIAEALHDLSNPPS